MAEQNINISVVSPVYQAANLVEELVNRLVTALNSITEQFEIILVEDASTDNSWVEIEKQCAANQKVKGIKLSKNFGQHQAIMAGLDQAQGKWVVVMDCDLQDPPEAISLLYQKAVQESYEVVFAKRINRKDAWLKKTLSHIFFQTLSYLTNIKLDRSIANFGIYHQDVVQAVMAYRKSRMVFPLMVRLVGFKQGTVEVQHGQRLAGKSSYSLGKQLNLALDIILSFSDKPLRLMMKLGFVISLLSFIVGIFNLYKYFAGIIQVPGYASLMISLWFLAGLIIFLLGFIGLYVGKTFEQVKGIPDYITQKSINLD